MRSDTSSSRSNSSIRSSVSKMFGSLRSPLLPWWAPGPPRSGTRRSATWVAGPVRVVGSPTSTSASPPGMRTITLRSTRPQRWKTSAETVAPVPQALVMPAPRSQARREISSVPLTLTKCTLAPSSKWASIAGPARARSISSGSSTSQTTCGLPMSPVSQRFTDATGAPTPP